MRGFAAAALAAMAAIMAGGCGGSGRAASPRLGHTIFLHACAECHTLAGHESSAVAGDLVKAHLSVADLASFAKIMPTRPRLSQAEAVAVAEYIHSVASSLRARGR